MVARRIPVCVAVVLASFGFTTTELGDRQLPFVPLLPGNSDIGNSDLGGGPLRFWIGETGPTGPMFSGPQQYPFVCFTFESGLGQPLVDNQEGRGSAVFEVDAEGNRTDVVDGYSKSCSIPTRVDYFYRSVDGEFMPLADPTERPADLAWVRLPDGRTMEYIVRVERGTLNRFIYMIAMLAPTDRDPMQPRLDAWNRRLIYYFDGGIGIGHWQGEADLDTVLQHDGLSRGYAIATSTGNDTSVHYNLTLAAETAIMVKGHFRAMYGNPEHTIGVGASGGAVQQYVLAQNYPRLLDGAIALASYSDMITQTIYALDCQLLEYYFDVTARDNPKWSDWTNRTLIEGMVASNTVVNRWTDTPGSSECAQSWREPEVLALNPAWAPPEYLEALEFYRFPKEVIDSIHWTHWDDLQNIYGLDEFGFARRTWDNEGVQYGLEALVTGGITKQEFLHLNANVGGWKPPHEMAAVNYPWDPTAPPSTFDPWDQLNINQSRGQVPAPRTRADTAAIRAAYRSGHVFVGRIDIPVIDARWYLEPELDMHHTQQSFATRARMLKAQGSADNQVIWIGLPPYDPIADAIAVMEQWLTNVQASPSRAAGEVKPPGAVDKCFDTQGRTIAAGDEVWHGILDSRASGVCTRLFPIYSTSRIVAGGAIMGDVFKCQTIPVAEAISRGFYGDVAFGETERARLLQIFPTGVCDYSLPDAGLPKK